MSIRLILKKKRKTIILLVLNVVFILQYYKRIYANFKPSHLVDAIAIVALLYIISLLIYKPFGPQKHIAICYLPSVKKTLGVFNAALFEEILFKILLLDFFCIAESTYRCYSIIVSAIFFFILHYPVFRINKNKKELAVFAVISFFVFYLTNDVVQAILIHFGKNLLTVIRNSQVINRDNNRKEEKA